MRGGFAVAAREWDMAISFALISRLRATASPEGEAPTAAATYVGGGVLDAPRVDASIDPYNATLTQRHIFPGCAAFFSCFFQKSNTFAVYTKFCQKIIRI